MDAATNLRLTTGAQALGVALDDAQVGQLARYIELLAKWNSHINLTTVVEPQQVVDRHFLDSLALVPLCRDAATLVDVGAGAGFPGLVLGIALPELRVTCVESIRKKVAFLQTLRREVVPNLEPLWARVETLRAEQRRFGIAVSRATWDPQVWLAEGAPLVEPGGLLIAMQGSEQPALVAPDGFTEESVRPYSVAGSSRRLCPFRRK